MSVLNWYTGGMSGHLGIGPGGTYSTSSMLRLEETLFFLNRRRKFGRKIPNFDRDLTISLWLAEKTLKKPENPGVRKAPQREISLREENPKILFASTTQPVAISRILEILGRDLAHFDGGGKL